MKNVPFQERGHYAFADRQRRVYHRRVALLPRGAPVPGHPCIGPERVLEFDGFFRIADLLDLVRRLDLSESVVRFDDIWHRVAHPDERSITMASDPRYAEADPAYPGLLTELPNPAGRRYRMLDGRRRLWKLESQGAREGRFYVIPRPEVFEGFWMLARLEEQATELAEFARGRPQPQSASRR